MTRFSFSVATLASVLATSSIAAHAADVRYRLTQIVPDTPASTLLTSDLNDRGQAVGFVQDSSGRDHAFAWRDGTLTNLAPRMDPNTIGSRATGNNDRGDIVGFFFEASSGAAVSVLLPARGETRRIDGFPGAFDTGLADINDDRQIMGNSFFEDGSVKAFIWEDGNLMPLPPLDGDTSAAGVALNEHGEVVGTSDGTTRHVVIWQDGEAVELNIPSAAVPRDLNDREQVVGELPTDQGSAAFLWESGSFTQLPSLTGAVRARATSVNNAGEIVGGSSLATAARATLWADSQVFDLNGLILESDPQRAFVTLEEAPLINEHGDIVAVGRDSRFPQELRTYLLTPVH
jgi:probable HAF family extracellular repeat protein